MVTIAGSDVFVLLQNILFSRLQTIRPSVILYDLVKNGSCQRLLSVALVVALVKSGRV
ncbi:MAG: hypothetical protein LBP87_03625 [Planctomycetaceae bacterium]|nr:hypothetical protein [Planctomycetaceae bacterium]